VGIVTCVVMIALDGAMPNSVPRSHTVWRHVDFVTPHRGDTELALHVVGRTFGNSAGFQQPQTRCSEPPENHEVQSSTVVLAACITPVATDCCVVAVQFECVPHVRRSVEDLVPQHDGPTRGGMRICSDRRMDSRRLSDLAA
jgi:hypothetical protein